VVPLDQRIGNALDALATDERDRHHAQGASLTRRDPMSLVATLDRTVPQPAQPTMPPSAAA
jgi:hypothetical protein